MTHETEEQKRRLLVTPVTPTRKSNSKDILNFDQEKYLPVPPEL